MLFLHTLLWLILTTTHTFYIHLTYKETEIERNQGSCSLQQQAKF